MDINDSLVTYIATTYYNITPTLGSIKPLCGYSDRNFSLVDSNDHKKYVLKIVNPGESDQTLTDIIDEIIDNAHQFCDTEIAGVHFVLPRLCRTSADKLSTYTSIKYNLDAVGHQDAALRCNLKMFEYFDGITMFDYINNCSDQYKPEKLYFQLGRVANQLFRFFRTQVHLQDSLKKIRQQSSFAWQLMQADHLIEKNLNELYPEVDNSPTVARRRLLVERALKEYRGAKDLFAQMTEYIFHSDLCNKNILLNLSDIDKLCLIDFQDIQVGPQVAELAILMLYNVLEQEQMPFEQALKWIPHWIYRGYQSSSVPEYYCSAQEIIYVPILMKIRLCQSLLNGQLAFKDNPNNDYVMHTNQRGWQLLNLMTNQDDQYYGAFPPNDKLASWWIFGPRE